jgi:hypothetical protein
VGVRQAAVRDYGLIVAGKISAMRRPLALIDRSFRRPRDLRMTDFDNDRLFSVLGARQRARTVGHVQRAQLMLVAAMLSAFGIVAVAAAMMGSLF